MVDQSNFPRNHQFYISSIASVLLNLVERHTMAPLVTGASGFIGAHVFIQLLNKGYSVRGTVRSQAKADYFTAKFPEAAKSKQISFVIVKDIAQPGAFKDAVKGSLISTLVDCRCRLYYSCCESVSFQNHGLQ
jgi:UDP-glucose 4-epimerase